MKTTKTITIDLCDFCRTEEAPYLVCFGCGKRACFTCRERINRYNAGVFFSSNDAYWCQACEMQRLTGKVKDNVFDDYLAIKKLRLEHVAWSEEFTKRMKEAEEKVKHIRK